MEIALALFFFVMAIAGHELGHAWAMRESGIRIKRIGIGIPWGIVIVIKRWNFLRVLFGARCKLELSPLLIGAFVEPYHPVCDYDITLKEEAYILGAGPLANMNMFLVIFSIWILQNAPKGLDEIKVLAVALGALLLVPFLWFMRRFLSLWIFPVLGILLSGFIVWTFLHISFHEAVEGSGSIILIGEIVAKSTTWDAALKTGMFINLVLATTNLLPLGILDGGGILGAILRRMAPSYERFCHTAGNLFLIALVVFSLMADGKRLIGYFF